jgi:hypothetical protein
VEWKEQLRGYRKSKTHGCTESACNEVLTMLVTEREREKELGSVLPAEKFPSHCGKHSFGYSLSGRTELTHPMQLSCIWNSLKEINPRRTELELSAVYYLPLKTFSSPCPTPHSKSFPASIHFSVSLSSRIKLVFLQRCLDLSAKVLNVLHFPGPPYTLRRKLISSPISHLRLKV